MNPGSTLGVSFGIPGIISQQASRKHRSGQVPELQSVRLAISSDVIQFAAYPKFGQVARIPDYKSFEELPDGPIKESIVKLLQGSQDFFDAVISGYQSNAYIARSVRGDSHPKGVVIKESRHADLGPDATFLTEILAGEILAGVKHVPAPLLRVQIGNAYYVVYPFVTGSSPSEQHPINVKHLKSLFDRFFEMDARGMLHRDLSASNMLLTKRKSKIIDLGRSRNFNPFDFQRNDELFCFPPFITPANSRDFEECELAKFVINSAEMLPEEDRPRAARDFFKCYLALKATYHGRRADMLRGCYLGLRDNLSSDEEKNALNTIEYEQLQAKLLAKPNDDLIDIEALRIDIDIATERYDFIKELYPDFCPQRVLERGGAILRARRLLEVVGQLVKQCDPQSSFGKYLTFQRQYAEYWIDKLEALFAEFDIPLKQLDALAPQLPPLISFEMRRKLSEEEYQELETRELNYQRDFARLILEGREGLISS